MKLNNVMLTTSSTKCHHMVNGGSQSRIVSCVLRLFLTTAWLSSPLHLQTHCMWCSHQRGPTKPRAQERFVIHHDCVRNEPMCLGLWKTSIERGRWWRNWFVVGVSDTTNGSQKLMWHPHPFVNKFMLALTTTGTSDAKNWWDRGSWTLFFAFGKQIISLF